MKTLYISDLDGTLLNKEASLSEFTKETLNQLIQDGMLFTYATARSSISASTVTQGLNIKLPVIVYNGTFIKDISNGEFLVSNYFGVEVKDLLDDLMSSVPVWKLRCTPTKEAAVVSQAAMSKEANKRFGGK